MAHERFYGPALYGGRPNALPYDPPRGIAAAWQGLVLPREADGVWAKPSQPGFHPGASGPPARIPGWAGGSQSAWLHDPESGADGTGNRRHEPAATHHRFGCRDPHAQASCLAISL